MMKKYKIIFGHKIKNQHCARNLGLKTLLITLRKMGYTVGVPYNSKVDRVIYWSAKRINPEFFDKKIIMEHGWIPRSTYQISKLGSNTQGHYAKNYQYKPLTETEKGYVLQYIAKLRKNYNPDLKKVKKFKEKIIESFILVPFQQAGDFNLKHSNTSFKKFYGNGAEANLIFKQGWIDYLKQYKFPYKLLFKQHPVDKRHTLDKDLKLPKNSNIILERHQISIHEIFASGLCKAIVSLNSNSVHEALIYNIPVICLDKLVWNDNTTPRPFAKDIKKINTIINTKPLENDIILAYLYHLIKNQWTLKDLQNPLMVEKLIELQGMVEPFSLRKKL